MKAYSPFFMHTDISNYKIKILNRQVRKTKMDFESEVILVITLTTLVAGVIIITPDCIAKWVAVAIGVVAVMAYCLFALLEIAESISDKWREVLDGATKGEIVADIIIAVIIFAVLYSIIGIIYNEHKKLKEKTKDGFND